MFTVRLFKDNGAQIVHGGVAYAIGVDYVNLTRRLPGGEEENLLFITSSHVLAGDNPSYVRIEVSNMAGTVIDTVRPVPSDTKEKIASAVRKAKDEGDLPASPKAGPVLVKKRK